MCKDLVEVQVFWEMMLCLLISGFRPFKEKWCLRNFGSH